MGSVGIMMVVKGQKKVEDKFRLFIPVSVPVFHVSHF